MGPARISEIDSSTSWHATTRAFQRMVLNHDGVWFVFYGNGTDCVYRTSVDDGGSWSAPQATVPGARWTSSQDILTYGDRIYFFHTDPETLRVNGYQRLLVKVGTVSGRTINWQETYGVAYGGYTSVTQDSEGHLLVLTRQSLKDIAAQSKLDVDLPPEAAEKGLTLAVCRSKRPHDPTAWVPLEKCLAGVNLARPVAKIVGLDRGMAYVVSMATDREGGMMFGSLYDGRSWRETVTISSNTTKVAGDDRRFSAEFDPTTGKMHLVYVDADNNLRYRNLSAPYTAEDWEPPLTEPGKLLEEEVFTCILSVDASKVPYGLKVLYGKLKYTGEDPRVRTGELYIRDFNGDCWTGKPTLVSEQGAVNNWYPNMNRDVSKGVCVLYTKGLRMPLSIMVSVTK